MGRRTSQEIIDQNDLSALTRVDRYVQRLMRNPAVLSNVNRRAHDQIALKRLIELHREITTLFNQHPVEGVGR